MAVDLIYFASFGKKSKVMKLLNMGVDVDAMNHNKETPLFFAAKNGNEAIVKCLLRRKADPNRPNVFGFSPVTIAAFNNRKRCLKLLLKHGGVFNPIEFSDQLSMGFETPEDDYNSKLNASLPLTEIPINHVYFDYVLNNAQIENCYRIKTCQVYGLQVTCKVYLERSDQKSLMEKEIQTLRSLRHPRVVTSLYTTCIADKNQYVLIMEPVSRINVHHVLHGLQEKLSSEVCKQILYETCLACLFVHREGLQHNFINSSSIYLDTTNHVKLGNFEYCTKLSEQRGDLPIQAFHIHLPYMAAEVLVDNATSDSSDVYSYGCLSWELFGRKIPWSWLSQPDIISMSKVQHSIQLPLPPSWPLFLQTIVRHSARKIPEQRVTFSQMLTLFTAGPALEPGSRKIENQENLRSSCNSLAGSSAQNKSRVTFSNFAMVYGENNWENSNLGGDTGLGKRSNFDVFPRRSSLKSHNDVHISGLSHVPHRLSSCVSQIQTVDSKMDVPSTQEVRTELEQCDSIEEDKTQPLQLAKFLVSKAHNHQRTKWSKNTATLKNLEEFLYTPQQQEKKPAMVDLVRDFLATQKEIEHRWSWSAISNAIRAQRVIHEERKQQIVSDAFNNFKNNRTKKWAKTATLTERDYLGYRAKSSTFNEIM